MSNPLTEALSSNPSMQQFLKIVDSPGRETSDQLIVIGVLTNFFNLTLLKGVKPENKTPKKEKFSKTHLLIYHKMKFIENEIYIYRQKHREKMIQFANDLIEFLSKWKGEFDGMTISVNQEELKEYLLSDPKEVVILENAFNFYFSLISPILNYFSTQQNVVNELKYVITDISKNLLPRISFFTFHRLEDKFRILFFSDQLPFRESFDQFVEAFPPENSQSYLNNFFQFLATILIFLELNKTPFDSTIVLLMIRLLFDKVYHKNPLMTTDGIDIIDEFKSITVKKMPPPPEYSPKFKSEDEEIGPVFRNDPLFGKAVNELQCIAFFNNPLDILYCLDQSLTLIEKAATEYNNYQTVVFPFEVTFELFMTVLISSQIRNWYNLSKMVETYTTESGLCPSFEFSKAKIIASVMQLEAMKSQKENESANKSNVKESTETSKEQVNDHNQSTESTNPE